MRKTKANYKPDSVDIHISGNHLSKRHTRTFNRNESPTRAYFVLLQEGLALANNYLPALGALTTHFHPYHSQEYGGYFLWRFPSV